MIIYPISIQIFIGIYLWLVLYWCLPLCVSPLTIGCLRYIIGSDCVQSLDPTDFFWFVITSPNMLIKQRVRNYMQIVIGSCFEFMLTLSFCFSFVSYMPLELSFWHNMIWIIRTLNLRFLHIILCITTLLRKNKIEGKPRNDSCV